MQQAAGAAPPAAPPPAAAAVGTPIPPPSDPCPHIEVKTPGGGMMYMLKRRADGPQLFCLGVGGLASTFDGVKVDGRDRTPVAIKQVALDKRAAERFEALHFRGLQTMTGRAHAGVVRFLGFFKGDDGKDGRVRLSFVFERCPMARAFLVDAEVRGGYTLPIESRLAQGTSEGCDLTSNPLKLPPYSHAEALCVVRQLLDACAYLHAQAPPIIHRDIKPDNVLLWAAETRASAGGGAGGAAGRGGEPAVGRLAAVAAPPNEIFLRVKLTDYDTVRRYDEGDLTVGSGTRPFMAPEVDVQTGTLASSRGSGGRGGGAGTAGTPGDGGGTGAGGGGKAVGHYGTDVDVFSVGATYFFLVSGHAPSPDLRQADWRLRFLGDVRYEPPVDTAGGALGGGGGGALKVPSAGLATAAAAAAAAAATAAQQRAKAAASASAGAGGHGGVADAAAGAAAPGHGSSSGRTSVGDALIVGSVAAPDSGVWGAGAGSGSGASTRAATGSSSSTRAGAPDVPTRPAAAPTHAIVSVLDHHFPPGCAQRAFLKGLVAQAPPATLLAAGGAAKDAAAAASAAMGGRRWTAPEALASLDRWFPGVPRLPSR